MLINELSAYRGRDLQHAAQIMRRCGDTGLTIEQCIDAVTRGYADTLRQQSPAKDLCPECNKSSMITTAVNRCKASMVGGGYTAVKVCNGCMYEEWVK